jgi:hypothetical protein
LIIAVPSREMNSETFSEQEKKHIKINEKINTLIGIVNNHFNKAMNSRKYLTLNRVMKREGKAESPSPFMH